VGWRSSPHAVGGGESLRRTLALAALVVVGVALVAVVRRPERARPPGERGHRVFSVASDAIRGLDLALDDRRLTARRAPEGWTIDGSPTTAATARALDDLVATLAGLRAVDVFRDRDGSAYGLDPPRATITVVTDGASQHLDIGAANAASSAVYARRAGDPRMLQVGALLVTELERPFDQR
jgi:hypothetical protein